MEMTVGMYLYLLGRKHTITRELVLNHRVERLRLWQKGETVLPNTLYLAEPGDYPNFSQLPDSSSCLVVNRENVECCPWPQVRCGSEPARLLEELTDIGQMVLQWDASMLRAILRHASPDEMLGLGKQMFPWAYGMVERDFTIVYDSGGFRDWMTADGKTTYEEVIRSLLMDGNYHRASGISGVFHFADTQDPAAHSLCRNILFNDRYYARLVMMLPGDMTEVPQGLMDLYGLFAERVQEFVLSGTDLFRRHWNDRLHSLCLSLAEGEQVEPAMAAAALAEKDWAFTHTYIAILLRFYSVPGWMAHAQTTVPYIAGALEREWPNSCAVIREEGILWIINHSMSKIDEESFFQRLAFFIRDHVCKAGVSPHFYDLRQLSGAAKAAQEALTIGLNRHPHFWYYQFDNYRSDYIVEKLSQELPGELLCHPAVLRLRRYDRENGTELDKTLRAYLENGLNMTAAAQTIFVHRTTFCRRMDHIRQLTKLEIEQPQTLLALLQSYQMK